MEQNPISKPCNDKKMEKKDKKNIPVIIEKYGFRKYLKPLPDLKKIIRIFKKTGDSLKQEGREKCQP
jgi:hypothetical protein